MDTYERNMISLAYEASDVRYAEGTKLYDQGNYWCQFTSYGTIHYQDRVVVVEIPVNAHTKEQALKEISAIPEVAELAKYPEKAEFLTDSTGGRMEIGTHYLQFELWSPNWSGYKTSNLQKWINKNLLPLLVAMEDGIVACDYRIVQDRASVLLTYENSNGYQYHREIPVYHGYGKGVAKDILKAL